jgi:hypothetical protein
MEREWESTECSHCPDGLDGAACERAPLSFAHQSSSEFVFRSPQTIDNTQKEEGGAIPHTKAVVASMEKQTNLNPSCQ